MPSRSAPTVARTPIQRVALASALLLLTAADAQQPDPSGCFGDSRGLLLCIERWGEATYNVRFPLLDRAQQTRRKPQERTLFGVGPPPGAPVKFNATFSQDFGSANVTLGPVTTRVVRISKQEAEARTRAATPATLARLLERFGDDRSVAVLLDSIVRRELRRMYDAEIAYFAAHGRYTSNLEELGWRSDLSRADAGTAGPSNLVMLQYAYAASVTGEPGLRQKFTVNAVGATTPTKGRVYTISDMGPSAGQVVLKLLGSAQERDQEHNPILYFNDDAELKSDGTRQPGDYAIEQL